MFKKISICIILFFILSVVLAPLSQIQADSKGIPNPLGSTGTFSALVKKIISALEPIVVSIAVIMIIYSGFLFMTAGGNDDKIGIARKTLIWSLVGLAVILIGSGFIDIIKDILSV